MPPWLDDDLRGERLILKHGDLSVQFGAEYRAIATFINPIDLANEKVRYCFECDTFPCENLKRLDRRYRTHYHMSFIRNLERIRDDGIDAFLAREREKWKCPDCGSVICCHNGICFDCGLDRLKDRKKLYRWDGDE